uniref:ATP synthase subunit a n=1 Tax=Dorcoceras hygrometricum TaxID=472368 RepID=G9FCL5_9LAMI|nr:atp6 gene product [Dorcoceras hygrometricum]AEK53305.1 ATPase subunit 6 [Dorcoceras hygrometricum]
MKRRFSETNLNSSSDTFSRIPNPNTTTLTESNPLLSGTQVAGNDTYNNHDFDEVNDYLRSEIFENVKKTFKRNCPDENKLLSIAEDLHNYENDFLKEILEDLKNKEGEHYDFAQQQLNKILGGTPPTITSPLDQFEIISWIPIEIGDLYFSFTNSSLFMLLTLSLVLLLFYFVTKKGGGKLVPNAWQSLVEILYDFVLNLVNEQIGGLSGNVKQKYFPCISVTFTFSLFRNLQGMIPYSFTVTSHFLITLGLSFSLFIGITIVGFQRNGLHFLSFSLPAGVPLPLAPFLVLLELISYCFRALSLGIRLFANMMAGHSLVKILSGFAWTMLCMNNLFYFIGDLGPLFIVLALTGLELGVAISQAHVSTISICIYLNDATNLHQSYLFIIEQKRGTKFTKFTRTGSKKSREKKSILE